MISKFPVFTNRAVCTRPFLLEEGPGDEANRVHTHTQTHTHKHKQTHTYLPTYLITRTSFRRSRTGSRPVKRHPTSHVVGRVQYTSTLTSDSIGYLYSRAMHASNNHDIIGMKGVTLYLATWMFAFIYS